MKCSSSGPLGWPQSEWKGMGKYCWCCVRTCFLGLGIRDRSGNIIWCSVDHRANPPGPRSVPRIWETLQYNHKDPYSPFPLSWLISEETALTGQPHGTALIVFKAQLCVAYSVRLPRCSVSNFFPPFERCEHVTCTSLIVSTCFTLLLKRSSLGSRSTPGSHL